MDSPIHFAEGANTTDQVPISQLIGPGVVIDVAQQAAANVDYLISVADITAFEAKHGPIPAGAIVLLNTGRAALYADRKAFNYPQVVFVPFVLPGVPRRGLPTG